MSRAAPSTLEQALAELRTLDPAVQQDALLILTESDDPNVAESMLEVLPKIDTSQPGAGYVVAQLISDLAGRGESRVVEHIIALFDRDLDESGDDHQFEAVACDAFRTLRAKEALPFLRQALLSKRWEYHEEDVAEALAAIGGSGEESVLLEALGSRRSDLRVAALRALRAAGTEKSIEAVEKAAKSSSDEIKVAALGTLCVLKPAQASEILERAVKAATDYALKSNVIRLVRDVQVPDMSDRLLPLLADSGWEPLRFEILGILVDRKHPSAVSELQKAMGNGTPSPWPKARSAALLLSLEYSDELVIGLLNVLATQKYDAERDSNFNAVNEAGEAIIRALVTYTPQNPRRHLDLVLLLDDLRRERIESFGRGKWLAAAAVKEIVGSDYYDAYDNWVAEYVRKHGLDTVVSPAKAPSYVDAPAGKKPWWKVW